VYKSLQDNNEDQCIIMLGESGGGKTENCRMIVKFLSKISGRFVPLQRQRSSNSITSFKSSQNSCSSTPKHKSSAPAKSVFHIEKSSCFKTDGVRSKKVSRVEFDFSYQKTNDGELKAGDSIKFCPKHNCCNQITSSSSSNASNPIDIPKRKNSSAFPLNDIPTTSKSFTIYETMNRAHNNKTTTRVPNCLDSLPDSRQMQSKCESLDLSSTGNQSVKIAPRTDDMAQSLDETIHVTRVHLNKMSYNKSSINLDNFKSAKRKVPTRNLSKLNAQLNQLEIQTMKERIAQAEIFLDAMGCASIVRNRDSSRYVSRIQLREG
jgi:myosin I